MEDGRGWRMADPDFTSEIKGAASMGELTNVSQEADIAVRWFRFDV